MRYYCIGRHGLQKATWRRDKDIKGKKESELLLFRERMTRVVVVVAQEGVPCPLSLFAD